jgi:hypothetical protein
MTPRLRALLLVQSITLAALMAWPDTLAPMTAAIGADSGDIAKHLWNLWWARAEADSGAPGLLTTLVNWPQGMRLYPIEPLSALAAVLLPVSPVLLANGLALLNLTLTGLAAGWLGFLTTGTRRGAHATAALVECSSFMAFTLHVGVGELRQAWWIPLGLGCLLRAQRSGSLLWFAALGLCLALATISCFYHGFFLATALSLYALVTLRRRHIPGYVLAVGLALLLTTPIVRTFADTFGEPEARVGLLTWMTQAFTLETFAGSSLDLAHTLLSRAGERATADPAAYAYTGGRYLGGAALLLALLGARDRRARPWIAIAAGATLLAMGNVIWFHGQIVTTPFTLPLMWLNRLLGWFAEPLNFPARFIADTCVALGVLGGLAVTRRRSFAWLVPIALLDIGANDLVPWPRATTTLPLTRDVEAPPGATADLSVMLEGHGRKPSFYTNEGALVASWITPALRVRAIAMQLSLRRPVQTVPIERQEMWALDGLIWTAALPLSEALVAQTVEDSNVLASLFLLHDRGFGSIALTHPCGERPEEQALRVLNEHLGAGTNAGCFTLWAVPDVPATEEQKAAWRRAQAARVSVIPLPTLREMVAP